MDQQGKGIDWQGLFSWSMQYSDGTKPSEPNVQPMSKEDKEWLQAVMKEYTFDDSNRLKEICEIMEKDVKSGFQEINGGKIDENDKVLDLLDECQELIEVHERNNLNLAIMGGINSMMQYILYHPDKEVRKLACNTLSQVVQNNIETQQVALKSGALNMMMKFIDEQDLMNKEAVLGALSSFLRAKNFNSKRQFIKEMNGIQFLATILNEKTFSIRLHKKLLILMYDLVLNDDNIFENNPTFVRKTFATEMNILDRIFEILLKAADDINNGQNWDVRSYSLQILFRIFQIDEGLLQKYNHKMKAYIDKIVPKMQENKQNEDTLNLLTEEVKKFEKASKAPTFPVVPNFKKESINKISQGDFSDTKQLQNKPTPAIMSQQINSEQ